MQKELTSTLKMTIAKLELKHLEFIDKLSVSDNDYIIRCIRCPETNELLSVNGDWEKVTNLKESDCIGKNWSDLISKSRNTILNEDTNDDFDSFVCDVLRKDGTYVSASCKSKLFPEINAIVTIGRVKK